MYLQNKYTKWYYSLIQTAQQRPIIVGYTENHHIIPRSIGGNNLQISKKLNITWDKVKYSLLHRADFESYQRLIH